MYQLAPWCTPVSYDEYIEQSRVSVSLFQGLLRYIDGWEGFTRIANQVYEFGPDAGWNGFILSPEWNNYKPVEYFDSYKNEILSYIIDKATEEGELWNELVANERYWPQHLTSKDAYLVCDDDQPVTNDLMLIKTAMAHYMLNECSQLYAQITLNLKPMQRILDTKMEDYYYLASLS